jgi:hypothetical protein
MLAVWILGVPLLLAQVRPPEGSAAAVSEREQSGLRGSVKSCTEESIYPGTTGAEGETYPERYSESTTEYDPGGRRLAIRSRNSDGSQWGVRYAYDASGRLLRTAQGVEGSALTETTYSYDPQGRLENISDTSRPDSPVSFRYDEHGRKTKIQISRPADYRPNVAVAGSPFATADGPPNLPGGGSATTFYDEYDRAREVQVRDASGELVNRAQRTYDQQGRVIEERQILDNPETMFPAETRAKMLEASGFSAEQLRQELRSRITQLMGGRSASCSVTFSYDSRGRLSHMSRRVFDREDEIETTYNQHGDPESEITRSVPLGADANPAASAPSGPSYSEVRYSYQYDQHENWIERTISYRSSPDAPFQPSTSTRRTLTYY